MAILRLAIASLWNRRLTAILTVLAIAISVTLLLGVEKVRTGTKASFANTISGTDLIVGARSGATQLLLYSVFRIGNATNNISMASYRRLAAHNDVAWTIPFSLGDNHRGYRVLGTTQDYFRHYRYGRKQNLELAEGKPFEDLFDVVIGAEIATALEYNLGDQVVITHGLAAEGFQKHDDLPFRISGILAPTGTPVDRTVHISLEAMEAIHVDWRGALRIPGMAVTADELRQLGIEPTAITAALFGLKSRFATFGLQREINEYRREPLLAILPGVALQELWDLMGTAETALAGISIAVVISGLLGMVIMLLAGLGERRREMAILRSVGARPSHIIGLLVAEAGFLTLIGACVGLAALYLGLAIAQPWIATTYGLFLEITAPTGEDLTILGAVIAAGFLAGLFPALKACRQSLADGMIVRS
ncbi:MAG: ABC transporter permease [Pseudomonadota bacterium]